MNTNEVLNKLIAEVERLKPRLRKIGGKDVLVTTDSVYKKLNRIIDFAKTLQQEQPEVNLEKEIDEYFTLWRQGASDEGCFNANSQLVSIYDCYRIARHFYELGLKARKE